MDSRITNILNKIEENGYEAYIVGGFVRDHLLNIDTVDVDICTNALPKDIIKIFNVKKDISSYGSISLKDDKYNYDITTYRKESGYENRKPQMISYTNNLLLDIERRDFTINSLCMNKNGQVFDYLNGVDDLNQKIIRLIGEPEKRFIDDPLRILRAIRFAVTLDFDLEPRIVSFINKNTSLVRTLSYTRKKEELDKMFSSKNVGKGLNLLKELNLLDALELEYDNIKLVPDLLGIWAQIKFADNYPFTKNNLKIIKRIRCILEEGKISNYTLFRDGLYISLVAGEILGIDKIIINEKYHNLVIYSKNELAITTKDIIEFVSSYNIKLIYEDVLRNVLNCNLPNDKLALKKYIINNWK